MFEAYHLASGASFLQKMKLGAAQADPGIIVMAGVTTAVGAIPCTTTSFADALGFAVDEATDRSVCLFYPFLTGLNNNALAVRMHDAVLERPLFELFRRVDITEAEFLEHLCHTHPGLFSLYGFRYYERRFSSRSCCR